MYNMLDLAASTQHTVEHNPPSDFHTPRAKPQGMHHVPAVSFHANATQAGYNTALRLVQTL